MVAVLVFSDSHQRHENMAAVLEYLHTNITHVLHLGDLAPDVDALIKSHPEIEFERVRGNCDAGIGFADERTIEIGGKKIWMVHGHNHGVKHSYQRIVYAAIEKEVDVCLFGHTHLPSVFYENGITFMNPGSISLPQGENYPSYGILDISGGVVTASVVLKNGDNYMSF